MKSNLRGTQYGSNEGVIEAVNEYLADQETAFYLEGIRKLEQRCRLSSSIFEKTRRKLGKLFTKN